jgi:hypothetical protein
MSDDTKPSNPIDEKIPKDLYAFPWTQSIPDGRGGTFWSVCPGMTLRDYFAAKALAGMLADPEVGRDGVDDEPERIADAAYAYADAMLKARGG